MLAGPFVGGVKPADAHTCAQVRVWVNGGFIPVGNCGHAVPCGSTHFGAWDDITVAGTGVGFTVCVQPPVAVL